MSKLGKWSTTAANNNSTPPDGWPEGQAPSTVNDCARELMASIRTAFQDLQYFDQDHTPTYVDATNFTVTGNQTSAIHAGRRLKIYDATAGAATVIYATVATASFTTVTTVTITTDAGQLTSSLSSFAIAILSKNNNSIPTSLNTSHDRLSASAIETTTLSVGGASTLQGTLTVSGAAALLSTLTVGGATKLNSTLTVSATAHAAALVTTIIETSATASLNLRVSGTTRWLIATNGSLMAGVDETYDFGQTGNFRPRDVFIGRNLTVSGAAVITGATRLESTLTVSSTLALVGGQIVFPAVQNASANANTLDDYEEGTFTPSLQFSGTTLASLVFSLQKGHYTKIGRVVNFNLYILLSAIGSSSGTCVLTGLPFASANLSQNYAAAAVHINSMSAISGMVEAYIPPAGTVMNLSDSRTGTRLALDHLNFTNNSELMISGHYHAA